MQKLFGLNVQLKTISGARKETWGTQQDWLQCNCWVWTRGRAQVSGGGDQRFNSSRETWFLPHQRGNSPRKAPCCRLESAAVWGNTARGWGRSRDKTKNPGGKQSGSGWGMGQDWVQSDISYLWLFVSPYLISRKEGRCFVLRGRALVTGTMALDGAGATVTLGRDGTALGCWDGDTAVTSSLCLG